MPMELTADAKNVMTLAHVVAVRSPDRYVRTELLLLGILMEGQGMACKVLNRFDVCEQKVRQEIQKIGDPKTRIADPELIAREADPAKAELLQRMADLNAQIVEMYKKFPTRSSSDTTEMVPRSKKAIIRAEIEARSLGQSTIGPEHILLGLVNDKDSVAAQVLMNLHADLGKIRTLVVEQLRDHGNM